MGTGGAVRGGHHMLLQWPFRSRRDYPRICERLLIARTIDSCYVKFGSQGVTALYPIPRTNEARYNEARL